MIRFKNFFDKMLIPNLNEALTTFYQHTDLKKAHWLSLSINKNRIAESLLTKELELHSRGEAFSLKIAQTPKGYLHQLWKNQSRLARGYLKKDLSLLPEFDSLIDSLFEYKILDLQKIISKMDSQNLTQAEMASEEKALEWMKVSFSLLTKAIVQSLTDKNLLFQTLLFIGTNPKTRQEEIRIIAFNLDIKFEFLINENLRIHIFNDKNGEYGQEKKPVLVGDFNFRKREMLDELIKLISALSIGIKFN
jgi:hypothetical protein